MVIVSVFFWSFILVFFGRFLVLGVCLLEVFFGFVVKVDVGLSCSLGERFLRLFSIFIFVVVRIEECFVCVFFIVSRIGYYRFFS